MMNSRPQSRVGRPGGIAAWLLVCLAILSAGFLWLRAVGADWLISKSQARYIDFRHDPEKDLKIGSVIAIPQEDAYGRRILSGLSAESRVLLVVSGACGECSEKGIGMEDLTTANVDRVVSIYTTRAEDLLPRYAMLPSKFRVVADPKNSLGHSLNATWLPRYYVIDGEGRMILNQEDPRQNILSLLWSQRL